MTLFATVFAAAVLCTLVSLSASYVFLLTDAQLRKWTPSLLAIACGVLLGDSFLHLLPEALESSNSADSILMWVLAGIVCFFILEQAVQWQQNRIELHQELSANTPLPFMNLAGDALHNSTDGVLIATSFMADTTLGIATTLAIILHEIPQEITDIAVLLRGGWSKLQAVFGNFLCALMTPVSAIGTLLLANYFSFNLAMLLAITAGGFIYIALANLMPLLLPARGQTTPLPQFGTLLIGLLSMQMLLWVE